MLVSNATSARSVSRYFVAQAAASAPQSMPRPSNFHTVTGRAAPDATRGMLSSGMPGALSVRPPAPAWVPINAMRGSSRCVTKRPLGLTSIQWRSSNSPVLPTSAAATGMPRQDFTG
jgi:hypothetical protein